MVFGLGLIQSGARNGASITAWVLAIELLVAGNLSLVGLCQHDLMPDIQPGLWAHGSGFISLAVFMVLAVAAEIRRPCARMRRYPSL